MFLIILIVSYKGYCFIPNSVQLSLWTRDRNIYKLLKIELKFITIFVDNKLFDSIVKKITNFPN